jgi:hypothetical protein
MLETSILAAAAIFLTILLMWLVLTWEGPETYDDPDSLRKTLALHTVSLVILGVLIVWNIANCILRFGTISYFVFVVCAYANLMAWFPGLELHLALKRRLRSLQEKGYPGVTIAVFLTQQDTRLLCKNQEETFQRVRIGDQDYYM